MANIKKKSKNRKHLGNTSLSRHNKENICSSKNEISNTGRRANEQFDIQWIFLLPLKYFYAQKILTSNADFLQEIWVAFCEQWVNVLEWCLQKYCSILRAMNHCSRILFTKTLYKRINTYSAAKRIDFSCTWYEKMKNARDEFTWICKE